MSLLNPFCISETFQVSIMITGTINCPGLRFIRVFGADRYSSARHMNT
jgi:hypothetical protein